MCCAWKRDAMITQLSYDHMADHAMQQPACTGSRLQMLIRPLDSRLRVYYIIMFLVHTVRVGL